MCILYILYIMYILKFSTYTYIYIDTYAYIHIYTELYNVQVQYMCVYIYR